MKKLLAFIAVLFLATAAIPQQPKEHYLAKKPKVPVNNMDETREAYNRLANSLDTLNFNLNKLP